MAGYLSTTLKMINLFLPNKKILILMISLGVFILILGLISIFLNQTPTPELQPIPTPKSQPLNNLPPLSVTPAQPLQQIYKGDSLEKNYERIINRKQLTTEEVKIKQSLLAPLEGNSGIVVTTDDFMVEFLKTPQYFMIQVLSTDIEAAKKNSQRWFKEQGISDQGICNLPIIFYPSGEVSNYLINNNLQFDPTPEGCE